MANLSLIKHIIVVMFENRSFDNMLGWLYPDREPQPRRPTYAASMSANQKLISSTVRPRPSAGRNIP
ncbi:alkaline phosphatase family protein [Tunturiibacter psychrotolerans]|uniref:alkaline phosphatase family protein n=1 Tax=Tunturiibacter psychrotolerans TaxID=3069686 RepID=UPI003341A17F